MSAAASPGAPAPLLTQVSQALQAVVRRENADQMNLTLSPDDLGRLRFEMTTTGDKLHISLFVERGGRLLTPPARLGLLPGVLRRALLDDGRAEEAELRVADLAGGFLIGNSLRGLMPARLADA